MEAGFNVSFFDQKSAPYADPSLVSEFERSSRASFELGATADYLVSDLLSFSSGLMYVERGGGYRTKNPNFVYVNQFSGSQQSDAYNYLRYRLSYLELPLSVNVNVFDVLKIGKEDQRLNAFVGASALANLVSKLRYNVFEGSSDPEENWESDKIGGDEPWVFAFNTGMEWRGGPLTLYVEYSNHLTSVYDPAEAGNESFDVAMGTVSFGMGFWFL